MESAALAGKGDWLLDFSDGELQNASTGSDNYDVSSRVTRRTLITGVATVATLVAGGLRYGPNVLASDEDDDGSDNSGPGSGGGGQSEDDSGGHGLPPAESEQVVGATIVQIIDERFEPNNILIETGQLVTWVNQDGDDHTASGRGMDTGVIHPGAEGSVTFLEPGEFNYTCNFHPEMLGLVTVTGESKATPAADESSAQAGDAPTTLEIDIVDFAFEPEVATIAVGGTVTWTNAGQAPHTVLGAFADSDIMDPSVSFDWTFDEPGTFEYQCGLHPAMIGTIEVVAAGSASSAEASPAAIASGEPEGVWLLDFAFDDPGLLPTQRAIVSLQPDGVLSADLIALENSGSVTNGHGTWSVDGTGQITSEWFMLLADSASGDVTTVAINEIAEIGADDMYAGTLEVVLTSENGEQSQSSGASAGHKLSSHPVDQP